MTDLIDTESYLIIGNERTGKDFLIINFPFRTRSCGSPLSSLLIPRFNGTAEKAAAAVDFYIFVSALF